MKEFSFSDYAIDDNLSRHTWKTPFFDRGVQHGPHDNWVLRNDRAKAGPNYGPQVGGDKTLTAIFPDGTKMWVRTLQEMQNLYEAIGVDWKSVYPYH